MSKKQLIIVALIVLFFGSCKFAHWYVFTEQEEFKRGTLTYYLRIESGAIENFPIIAPLDEPVYSYWNVDGTQPAMNGVAYESAQTQAQLEPIIFKYLEKQGYSRRNAPEYAPNPTFCKNQNDLVIYYYVPKQGRCYIGAEEYTFDRFYR